MIQDIASTSNPFSGTRKDTLINPNDDTGTVVSDSFGSTAATSSKYFAVSAPGEDTGADLSTGRVYLYDLETSTLLHTFTNPNDLGPDASDGFGAPKHSIALTDEYLMVGAYLEHSATVTDVGIAYVFDLSDYSLAYTIDNPNQIAGDQFGYACAINSTHFFVSCPRYNQGVVHRFDITDASYVDTLTPPDTVGNYFGENMVVSDDYIVVAQAQWSLGVYYDLGRIEVFNASGVRQGTISNPLGNNYSGSDMYFSRALALDGDNLLAGMEYYSAGVYSSYYNYGRAYYYDLTDRSLIAQLPNPYSGTQNGNRFGNDVAMTKKYMFISAPFTPVPSASSGLIYVYDKETQTLIQTIQNPNHYNTPDGDTFSRRIVIDKYYLIAGVSTEDEASGTSSGVAYVFV